MNINNFNIARYFFNINYTGDGTGDVLYWSPAAGKRFGAELLGDDVFTHVARRFRTTYSSRYGGFDGLDNVYVNFNRRYISELCERLASINPSVIVFNVADGRELVFFDALCSVVNARGVALLHNVDDYLRLAVARELGVSSSVADQLYADALDSTRCGRQQPSFMTGHIGEFTFGNYVRTSLPTSDLSGGVVSVGRFNARFKRTNVLIDAAVANNLPLKLFGTVEPGGGVAVPSSVKHVPYASSVDQCYSTARLLAIPSIVESFPNVVLEAWSAGVPVVAIADCLAMRSLITDGVDGFLAKSTLDFADKLVEAYNAPPDVTSSVIANASMRANAYSPKNVLAELMEVIDDELTHARHARP